MKEDFKKIISGIKVFEDLTDEEKDILCGLLKSGTYHPSEIIYSEGEPGDSLDIITSGKVRICRMTVEGDYMTLSTAKAGEIFGIMSFIDASMHSATIIADEETHILVLRKTDFDGLLNSHPVIYGKIVRNLAVQLSSIVRNMNVQYMDMMHMMFRKSK
ncbi:MAG: cyclic nucleotide-binding domain-containing protein [Thermodesulfovibrionales bacterium]|nr:cyclic nucleotide-binding domain-containing protein [Thermodesulfovibrionales bacterium]